MLTFKLTDEFISNYETAPVDWGFGVLSEVMFLRTYSRDKKDGGKEQWYETVRRVVEGCYTIQKNHCKRYRLPWDEDKAQRSAQEMYERIFSFKLWPAGRMLEYLGSDVVHDNEDASWLQNCAMVSTERIGQEYSKPFATTMSMLMKGVGVGFDVKGAGKLSIHQPGKDLLTPLTVWIPDTTEGWVDSTSMLLDSYFKTGKPYIEFKYNLIRPAGSIISSGGIAPGPGPLMRLHAKLRSLLESRVGDTIDSRLITDIMNLQGKAVASGGRRRSAEISLGPVDDADFINLKDYTLPENQERTQGGDAWAWASNNTIVRNSTDPLDYKWFAQRQLKNGEPGIFNLDVARNYGRILDGEQPGIDAGVVGLNPCGEQTLHDLEFCCLSTVNTMRHESEADFYRSIKFAYLLGKSTTLLPTMWEDSNAVQMRNRRIGLSLTGIAQFVTEYGLIELLNRADEGYKVVRQWDKIYSEWLGVRESIKVTTVKPEGSASLLAGATPGVHYPVATTYIRRMGFNINDPKIEIMRKAGYRTEPAIGDPESTVLVEIPVKLDGDVPAEKDVSVGHKFDLAWLMQCYWSDNSVSCTVSFHPDEVDTLATLLEEYEGGYKSLSFLPLMEAGAYKQMPYEPISDEVYHARMAELQEVDFSALYYGIIEDEEREGEMFCTTDRCEIGV